MNIKECGFKKENLLVMVLPTGVVLLGNAETKKIYEVNIVKLSKPKIPDGYKKIKVKRL